MIVQKIGNSWQSLFIVRAITHPVADLLERGFQTVCAEYEVCSHAQFVNSLSIVIDFLMVSLIKLVIYDVKVQSNYNFVLLRVHL